MDMDEEEISRGERRGENPPRIIRFISSTFFCTFLILFARSSRVSRSISATKSPRSTEVDGRERRALLTILRHDQDEEALQVDFTRPPRQVHPRDGHRQLLYKQPIPPSQQRSSSLPARDLLTQMSRGDQNRQVQIRLEATTERRVHPIFSLSLSSPRLRVSAGDFPVERILDEGRRREVSAQ